MTEAAPSHLELPTRTHLRSAFRKMLVVLLMTLALLTLGVGYGRYRFGSVPAALAYLRGERLLIDEPLQSISGVHPGSQIVVPYALTNLTGRPVKLVGMATSCSCSVIEELPIAIAAAETRMVAVTIKIAENRSDFSGSLQLFTDDPHSPEIDLGYSVRVDSSASAREPQAD